VHSKNAERVKPLLPGPLSAAAGIRAGALPAAAIAGEATRPFLTAAAAASRRPSRRDPVPEKTLADAPQGRNFSRTMANRDGAQLDITPEVLLKAYACGIFPMAESADDPALYWIEPEQRGIIPLDGFHVPSRLARTVRSERFTVVSNRDFDGVIEGCAEAAPGRARTWINGRIRKLYRKLYDRGHCHTVEVYDGDDLVGGLYGVSLARTFFGESMFHRARDASKVALVHLIARLRAGGFQLLDTQFITDHLKTFGAAEVPRRQYHKLLAEALHGEADFAVFPLDAPIPGDVAVATATARRTDSRLTA